MRLVWAGLVSAGMLITQTAGAACIARDSRDALDVEALKTQLMVQTLTCKNDDLYNAFISKFKTDLNSDERVTRNYFAHEYGRASQRQQDEYMTNLANTKATASQHEGSAFCQHNDTIFKEVLSLKNGAELREYAAGRVIGTPTAFTTCDGTAAPAPTTRTRRTAARRH